MGEEDVLTALPPLLSRNALGEGEQKRIGDEMIWNFFSFSLFVSMYDNERRVSIYSTMPSQSRSVEIFSFSTLTILSITALAMLNVSQILATVSMT